MTLGSTSQRKAPSKAVAILGRRDFPTDGIVDYCNFLGDALARQDFSLETFTVPWLQRGWVFSLYELWRQSRNWRGRWAVIQYTALSWSRRGFPFFALAVLGTLRLRSVRCAVVFHDAFVHPSDRLVDRVRDRIQNWIMARLYKFSQRPILTAPAATLCWIPRSKRRAVFIPIGANIPEVIAPRAYSPSDTPKIISVFSVTGGAAQAQEIRDIVQAATHAGECVGPIRLEVFGRGSQEARDLLDHGLTGANVALKVHGVIDAARISEIISRSHVVLNVRGLTTSRRGTSIAGIACAVPVVGYGYPGTDPPIDAAGVLLAPWRNPQYLGNLLVQLLSESSLWNELHERSKHAQSEYFSWNAVARRYRETLTSGPPPDQLFKYRLLVLRDHPTVAHSTLLQRTANHPKLDILVAYRRLGATSPEDTNLAAAHKNNGHSSTPTNDALLQGYPWILIPANGDSHTGSTRTALKSKAVRQLVRAGAFDAIYINDGPVADVWNVILRGKDAPLIIPNREQHRNGRGKSKTSASSRSRAYNNQDIEKNIESFLRVVESAISRVRTPRT
jgi:glycosyltransferase involved in cell wall biosynthesis